MKQLSLWLAATALIISSAVSAHQERVFDAGKSASFQAIADSSAERAQTLKSAHKTSARCIRGIAADTYPCKNVDMLSFVDYATLGLSFVNDMWGWTDKQSGKNYALVGGREGTVAVDVSNPRRPVVLGLLPAKTTIRNFWWRDLKVYNNHAYIVSESIDHGMQVLDLRQLRDIDRDDAPVVLTQVAQYDGFSRSHNININEDTGYAYVVGANTCLGGLEIIDIRQANRPTSAGCYDKQGYVHDTQCVVYKGPDRRFRGREICFNSSANRSGTAYTNALSIIDVSDKSNIKTLGHTVYGNGLGYSHQGWLTPNQATFIHGDELDEYFGSVSTTTARLWNVSDLTNPDLFAETTNGMTSVDHNIYTKGRYSYASNYTTGLRIFDIRNVASGIYKEVAYFDVFPEHDNANFDGGAWSSYIYFGGDNDDDSGLVAVSSIDRGLFLLRPRLDD